MVMKEDGIWKNIDFITPSGSDYFYCWTKKSSIDIWEVSSEMKKSLEVWIILIVKVSSS